MRTLDRRLGFMSLAAVRRLPIAVVVGLLVAVPAEPCSICRCGDATFNALGKDGYSARGFRAALDWERFDKDEGDPAAGDAESQVENRFTALASYGFGETFTIMARVPYSLRNLTSSAPGEEPRKTHTSGFSDPEVYGQIRLWASHLSGGMGRRASLSLSAGVKTSWGQNNVTQAEQRVDEHAQPGTGSTDALGSLALLYLIDRESSIFASAGYRRMSGNDFGYRYGSTFIANVAYEHKLGPSFDGVVELNLRHAGKDRLDAAGASADDTGGFLLYVTPRFLLNVGRGFVLRIAGQIPLARDLNGFQKERAVANVGLTYLFTH